MKFLRLLALTFAATVLLAPAAHAHDALQSSTDIQLLPGKMAVEITLSRASARQLLDYPPTIPITDDNFEALYHPLLIKSATQMLAITVDGKPLEPLQAEVTLFETTDIQFVLVYPRPSGGRLSVTTNFILQMSEGYTNSLNLSQGGKVLAHADQSDGSPIWEVTLGKEPPLAAVSTDTETHDTYFIIPHFGYLAMAAGVVIILLAIWRIRQKSRS